MTTKAQISQGRQEELENQIALLNRIERETHTIMRELDTASLVYFGERFMRILKAADKTKGQLIERMALEKEAAKNGRENGQG